MIITHQKPPKDKRIITMDIQGLESTQHKTKIRINPQIHLTKPSTQIGYRRTSEICSNVVSQRTSFHST